jgi:hypothetical protein
MKEQSSTRVSELDQIQNQSRFNFKVTQQVITWGKNSLAVFQFAEKHRDKADASEIIGRTLLEEDVCFVEEKNCIPMAYLLAQTSTH